MSANDGFNDILEKLFYGHIRKMVFEKLGTMANEIANAQNLSNIEKKAAKLRVLGMIEDAFKEFVPEMRRRIERNEASNVDNGRRMGQ